MEYLGEHSGRKVYWLKYSQEKFGELPDSDWVCLAMENGLPDYDLFQKFARASISKDIVEFKAFGKLSTKLDDWFDEVVVILKVIENQPDIFVSTTWHDKESLADAFWQCFHATVEPDNTVNENIKIVCFHFENIDKREELKEYINRFNQGWLPPEE